MEDKARWGLDGQKSRPPASMRRVLWVWSKLWGREKALALLVSAVLSP